MSSSFWLVSDQAVSDCEPHLPVEEAVEGLAAFDCGLRVDGLEDLGEGVEETPRVAGEELLVPGAAPLLKNGGHLAGCDRPAVDTAHDHVVGRAVRQVVLPVGGDAAVEVGELVA